MLNGQVFIRQRRHESPGTGSGFAEKSGDLTNVEIASLVQAHRRKALRWEFASGSPQANPGPWDQPTNDP